MSNNKKRSASPSITSYLSSPHTPPKSPSSSSSTSGSPAPISTTPYKPDLKKQKQVDTRATLSPPTFAIGDEAAKTYLEENGYVVFRDVVNEEKNTKAVSLLWDWLEGLGTGIKRGKVGTWENKNWPEMFVNGIFERYGIGQSAFMWYLRHECRNVFEFLCGTNELLCSMDGCSVFRPWMVDKKWKTVGGWWHFDCSRNVSEALSVAGLPDCIQGALCLLPATAESGGFACVPKSHLLWNEYFDTHTHRTMGHWVPLNPDDSICKDGVRILAPKNSMICWNSKLVHCNAPGDGPHSKTNLLRIVAYISMQSSNLLKEEKLAALVKKRKEAINKYASTSHWSIFCQPKTPRHQRAKSSNPVTPATARQPLPDLTDPKIKDLVEGTFNQTTEVSEQ
eukprot:Phypoly_transcript_09959.p1 GENE.Phypoly_transcript_09959~~Phypoly_transcript_09959.p1  ORF type:complete len:402 (+),score=66.12 Phypoly_transcript_09959:26-1207(+)